MGEHVIAVRVDDDEWEDGQDTAEREAIARSRHDLAAFAPLYDHYHDAIYGYCLRRLGQPDAAADATSQTFMRAMTAIDRYRSGSFRAWLFAIAHNVVIDQIRRQRPHQDLDTAWSIPSNQPSPDALAEEAEQRRTLMAALARLTADQRNVVELRLAGLTGPEIAEALHLSIPAVKSSQFRAYQRLRALLRDIDPRGDRS